MTLAAQQESDLAEHELLCREHSAVADADAFAKLHPRARKLYRMSLVHRGRKVGALELYGDQQVFAYVDRLPSCRGYVPTCVSELRAGDKFVRADRVWTVTWIGEAT